MRKRNRMEKQKTTHVKNGGEEPVEEDNGETDVGCGPPRDGKRRAVVCDLAPVKGENAHRQAVSDAEQLVDFGVVGSHPAHPGEAREGGEEIGRQEVCGNNQSG